MKVPIVHLTEGNVAIRVPRHLKGKKFSVISLGLCNFRCPYCYLGGGQERSHPTRLEKAINVDLNTIKEFITEQVEKGNPVKISGGEPTLLMAVTGELVHYAKDLGAYVCIDSSGWNPDRVEILAKMVDQVALDIKGPPRYVERITQASLPLSWYGPIQSIMFAARTQATVEVRTPIFGFTHLPDLLAIADKIPQNAFWVLRRFITHWVPFDKYSSSALGLSCRLDLSYPPWLTSPCVEFVQDLAMRLARERPSLQKQIVLLLDSPRDSAGKKCTESNLATNENEEL